ncbi:MAG: flagellar basal body P-ring formation chaperone FlgA [Nibricoccus sp.]
MNFRVLTFIFSLLAATIAGAAQENGAVSYSRDQAMSDLARQLSEKFQVRGELQLELLRPWVPLAAAEGTETVIVECPARLTSSLLVHVRFRAGERVLSDQALSLRAQLFRDVYAVRASLERDSIFDPNQLDVRRVDVLRERDTVAVEDATGDFVYAVSSSSAGRLLTWRDLVKRPLVRKGQVIEVAAVDGTMTVTAKALAMENGAAGDSIRVRNVTSKKDFTACVVAEARAEVRF